MATAQIDAQLASGRNRIKKEAPRLPGMAEEMIGSGTKHKIVTVPDRPVSKKVRKATLTRAAKELKDIFAEIAQHDGERYLRMAEVMREARSLFPKGRGGQYRLRGMVRFPRVPV